MIFSSLFSSVSIASPLGLSLDLPDQLHRELLLRRSPDSMNQPDDVVLQDALPPRGHRHQVQPRWLIALMIGHMTKTADAAEVPREVHTPGPSTHDVVRVSTLKTRPSTPLAYPRLTEPRQTRFIDKDHRHLKAKEPSAEGS